MSEELKITIQTLLLAIHKNIRDGNGDSEETSDLREQLSDAMELLPVSDELFISDVSGDLYALSGREIPVPSNLPKEDWMKLFEYSRKSKLHKGILELLRASSNPLDSASTSLHRAESFEALGFPLFAKAFAS